MSKYGYIVFNPPVLTKWKMKNLRQNSTQKTE